MFARPLLVETLTGKSVELLEGDNTVAVEIGSAAGYAFDEHPCEEGRRRPLGVEVLPFPGSL